MWVYFLAANSKAETIQTRQCGVFQRELLRVVINASHRRVAESLKMLKMSDREATVSYQLYP